MFKEFHSIPTNAWFLLYRWGKAIVRWVWRYVRSRSLFVVDNRQLFIDTQIGMIPEPAVRLAVGGYTAVRLVLARDKRAYIKWMPVRADLLVGWGHKRSGRVAVKLAKKYGLAFLLLEDGFLRSNGRQDDAISIVVDDLGIFYDASRPSRLERQIPEAINLTKQERARQLIKFWQQNRLSKYNAEREFGGELPDRFVLVIDQVLGDRSVSYGQANQSSFYRMLQAALDENPHHVIVVKTHPDVKTFATKSHFDTNKLSQNQRIMVISDSCHPVRLIEYADAVYTVTSQMGFEALIWGKRVRTFGMPFYAGWGLTIDEIPRPYARSNASLEQLVYAALVAYPRYVNLIKNERCEVEQAMAHIALQHQKRLEIPKDLVAVGFDNRQKKVLRIFLQGSRFSFYKNLKDIEAHPNDTLVIWGNAQVEVLRYRNNVLRLENGFLQSFRWDSGRGVASAGPSSLIVDDIGMYYDATRPSRLEKILHTQQLSPTQIERAENLRTQIVDLYLPKCTIDSDIWQRPIGERKVILVVGQVESSTSVVFGSAAVTSNDELVKRVRSNHRSAYLVYKPHPEVLSRSKQEDDLSDETRTLCDEVIDNIDMDKLFTQIDELHTMTSFMGFAALLRGIRVVCYGLPFYAGWGLTTDMLTCERRQRALSLNELVYGTLIAYPRYIHDEKHVFIEPEMAIKQWVGYTRTHKQVSA